MCSSSNENINLRVDGEGGEKLGPGDGRWNHGLKAVIVPDHKKKLLPFWTLWCKALSDTFIMGFNEGQQEAVEEAWR